MLEQLYQMQRMIEELIRITANTNAIAEELRHGQQRLETRMDKLEARVDGLETRITTFERDTKDSFTTLLTTSETAYNEVEKTAQTQQVHD